MTDPSSYFKTSSDIIRLALMMYILLLLPHERGIDIIHETIRF